MSIQDYLRRGIWETRVRRCGTILRRMVLAVVLFSFPPFAVAACSSGSGHVASHTPTAPKVTSLPDSVSNPVCTASELSDVTSKAARAQIHLSGAVGVLNARRTAVKIKQGTLLTVTVPRVTHAGNPQHLGMTYRTGPMPCWIKRDSHITHGVMTVTFLMSRPGYPTLANSPLVPPGADETAGFTILHVAGKNSRSSAMHASVTVPRTLNRGLLAAYADLHRAGLTVSFKRSFSIDWSGECIPLVTGSNPDAKTMVPSGSVVLLSTAVPPCAMASPAVPIPPPEPARVPSFSGKPLTAAIRWVEHHRLTWAATIPPLRDGNASSLYANYMIANQKPRSGAMLALGIAHGTGWQPTPLHLTVKSARAH